LCVLISLLLVSCGGSANEPAANPSKAAAAAKAKRQVPPGSISREAVVEVVDQGFPRFLQRVQVEPTHDANGFVGWSVVALQPESFWRGIDLRPGDVVQAINDKAIQWPDEAWDVFESLRVATELKVLLKRDGDAKQLVFPIVGPPQPKPAEQPPSAG
jgi:type II secretory pathway component PulC